MYDTEELPADPFDQGALAEAARRRLQRMREPKKRGDFLDETMDVAGGAAAGALAGSAPGGVGAVPGAILGGLTSFAKR